MARALLDDRRGFIDFGMVDQGQYADIVFRWAWGAAFQPKGGRPDVMVACPYHDDSSPSLHADLRTGKWHCFGCGASGDLFHVVARQLGLSRPGDDWDLVRDQFERVVGSELPAKDASPRKRHALLSPAEPPEPTSGDRAEPDEFARKWGNPAEWRGMLTAGRRNLAAHDDAQAWLEKRGISAQVAQDAMVAVFTRDDVPRGWWIPPGAEWVAVIPAMGGSRVLSMELRPSKPWPAADGKKPGKCRSSGKALYRAPLPRGGMWSRWRVLCEGLLDALVATTGGAAAYSPMPGVESWIDSWGEMFWNRSVLLAYDKGDEGEAGMTRVAQALQPYVSEVRRVEWKAVLAGLPRHVEFAGKDVGELGLALGPRAALDLLLRTSVAVDPHHAVRVVGGVYRLEEASDHSQAPDDVKYGPPLGDCTFRVLEAKAAPDGGLDRLIEVRPADYTKPAVREWVSASALATPMGFDAWLVSRTGCTMWASPPDWRRVRQHELNRLVVPTIVESDALGRMPDPTGQGEGGFVPVAGPWLFSDGAVEGGEVIADEGGRCESPSRGSVVWNVGGGGEIPRVCLLTRDRDREALSLADAVQAAVRPWSGRGAPDHRFLVGLAAMCPFLPEIMRLGDGFPVGFCLGSTETGKTQFLRVIQEMWGIQGRPGSIFNSTANGVIQRAAHFSCIPLCLDEFRNTRDMRDAGRKLAWFRALFDRSAKLEGRLGHTGADRVSRAAVFLAGEHAPATDEAVMRRLLLVQFNRYQRVEAEHYERLFRVDWSVVGRTVLARTGPLWESFTASYAAIRRTVGALVPSSSRILHSAVVGAAGWSAVSGEDAGSLLADLTDYVRRANLELKSSNPLERFWDWVASRIDYAKGNWVPNFGLWRVQTGDRGTQLLCLNVREVYTEYSLELARLGAPIDGLDVLWRFFADSEACESTSARVRMGSTLARCWRAHIDHLPADLAESAKAASAAGSFHDGQD